MHYFHVVLIDPQELGEQIAEKDIENKVEHMMAPYDEELEVEPYNIYLDEDAIKGMREHYQTHDLAALALHMEDWDCEPGGVDSKGLYRVSTRNPQGHWDYWRIGGRWDGVIQNSPRESDNGFNWSAVHETLPNNTVILKDTEHDIQCYSIVTPDGEWSEKQLTYKTGWQPPYIGSYNELTDEQRAANEAARHEENERLETEWMMQRRDIFAKYGRSCLAIGLDYHS